ncbi:hypothetical protein [Streptomyces sp. NPDC093109]|uniref:hypothetical protein n=1 Tax=Streptomyces sp. NPDC093109 TaxID=3154977 RepID=UPI00344FE6CC
MRGYRFLAGERVTAAKLNMGELIGFASITANAPTTTSTTEVAIITTPTVTFKAGRAYEFELRGLVQHSTANLGDLCAFRIRRSNTTGTLIRNLGTIVVTNRATTARNNNVTLNHIGINTSVLDITVPVVATYSWDTGSSSTFTFAASAATPASLAIWDLGTAVDYPGAGTI